uniref:G1/S-specific cyclin-D3 n=2 Tax=Lygus hesperus TaxID=30085 RepID=A0A146M9C4_LYGHE
MTSLLCTENPRGEARALFDSHICTSQQVFDNLLLLELRYTPRTNYIETVQNVVQSESRRLCTSWMLELTEDCKFEDTVFPMAVSIMDRFLCLGSVSRAQFQLTACTSLMMASKLRSVHGIPGAIFEHHSNYTINSAQLVSWEALMAFKMKWDLESVTANDFVDHMIARLPAIQKLQQSRIVRCHAHVLAHLAITDSSTITMKPSLIATAAIIGALRGLNLHSVSSEQICDLTGAAPSTVEYLVMLTEKLLENYTTNVNHSLQCFDSYPTP